MEERGCVRGWGGDSQAVVLYRFALILDRDVRPSFRVFEGFLSVCVVWLSVDLIRGVRQSFRVV